ncbi:hypothetical protein J6590_022422 [Homalodisca vitripennis]|nr:hypothetical protein J6590_022422 [Homalodisca vitripennis]
MTSSEYSINPRQIQHSMTRSVRVRHLDPCPGLLGGLPNNRSRKPTESTPEPTFFYCRNIRSVKTVAPISRFRQPEADPAVQESAARWGRGKVAFQPPASPAPAAYSIISTPQVALACCTNTDRDHGGGGAHAIVAASYTCPDTEICDEAATGPKDGAKGPPGSKCSHRIIRYLSLTGAAGQVLSTNGAENHSGRFYLRDKRKRFCLISVWRHPYSDGQAAASLDCTQLTH